MNLLKKNEQHKAALREFKEKHGKEVAALKHEIKRLKALDQPKNTENGCTNAQYQEENAKLEQTVAELRKVNADIANNKGPIGARF
nr:unnamed protein product [Callosobruchus chinensis]